MISIYAPWKICLCGHLLSFGEEKDYQRQIDALKDKEDYIILPTDCVKRHRVNPLVERLGNILRRKQDSKAFEPHVIRKDLCTVRERQRSPSKIVKAVVDEEEWDDR